jgi:hypothetical protein
MYRLYLFVKNGISAALYRVNLTVFSCILPDDGSKSALRSVYFFKRGGIGRFRRKDQFLGGDRVGNCEKKNHVRMSNFERLLNYSC